MKASVVLAHPYRESFNHAIFETVCRVLREKGVEVLSHDLYAERFDPVLTVEELGSDTSRDPLVNRCARELVESDLLFFIHPNWWGQPPAVLKGYIDRVIRPPHAYDFPPGDSGGGLPIGKLAGKRGVVINTSNTAIERENDYFGDPLERIWGQSIIAGCSPSSRTATRTSGGAGSRRPKGSWTRRSRGPSSEADAGYGVKR